MDNRDKSYGHRVHYGPRMILSTLLLAMSVFTSSTTAAPISDNPAAVARATLEKRATWRFEGYSNGQACRGGGNTSSGGSGPAGCSPIDSRGVTRYSYNGGGQFRLTGYLSRQCTGEVIICVNGGSVTCLDAPVNWSGYIVSQI
jgi:hypothetical protein